MYQPYSCIHLLKFHYYMIYWEITFLSFLGYSVFSKSEKDLFTNSRKFSDIIIFALLSHFSLAPVSQFLLLQRQLNKPCAFIHSSQCLFTIFFFNNFLFFLNCILDDGLRSTIPKNFLFCCAIFFLLLLLFFPLLWPLCSIWSSQARDQI